VSAPVVCGGHNHSAWLFGDGRAQVAVPKGPLRWVEGRADLRLTACRQHRDGRCQQPAKSDALSTVGYGTTTYRTREVRLRFGPMAGSQSVWPHEQREAWIGA